MKRIIITAAAILSAVLTYAYSPSEVSGCWASYERENVEGCIIEESTILAISSTSFTQTGSFTFCDSGKSYTVTYYSWGDCSISYDQYYGRTTLKQTYKYFKVNEQALDYMRADSELLMRLIVAACKEACAVGQTTTSQITYLSNSEMSVRSLGELSHYTKL